MRNIFSFDAETDGLYGEPFAIGALVLDHEGNEVARFFGRLSDDVVTNAWVKENVLPALASSPVTHPDIRTLLKDFAAFYSVYAVGADIMAHVGVPVEANVLRRMHDLGFMGDFEGPFPLLDISSMLFYCGENPTVAEEYVQKHQLTVGTFEGGTHNPLYDSAVAAVVFRHLMEARKQHSLPRPVRE